MNQQHQRYADAKFIVPRFMAEHLHSQKRTDRTEKKSAPKQELFGDAPMPPLGFIFICTEQDKNDTVPY